MHIDEVAQAIDWPVAEWPGNCYAVAMQMYVHCLVDGEVRYGHYLGPIAPDTMFSGRPIVRHGWIEKPDGFIIDPTRWVFENVEPYIYVGPNDYYDAGGNVFLERNLRPPPSRSYLKGERVWKVTFPKAIEAMLPGEPAEKNLDQLMWVAHLPLNMLGSHAKGVYQALIDIKEGALIPIDNRNLVMEEKRERFPRRGDQGPA